MLFRSKDAKEKNLPPRKVSEIFSVGPGRPGWRLPGDWMKINVFKVVVLMGTFALALAFAGNDLVNFMPVCGKSIMEYQFWT